MKKDKPQKPATPPDPFNGEPWRYEIEPVAGMFPFGRYRITLKRGFIRYGGNNGHGWYSHTYSGARRKAERELLRRQKAEKRLELRRAWMDGGPSERTLIAEFRTLTARHGLVFPVPYPGGETARIVALSAHLWPLVPRVRTVRPPRGGSGAPDAR